MFDAGAQGRLRQAVAHKRLELGQRMRDGLQIHDRGHRFRGNE
ncbi:hypothetical protein BamMEX5DRAFT_0955 [Burkholderia ambifaria MEX-5]|uniref:Uncharacterized protein n=1 Tax=Burkholderia ambifaria MEX-5 TaxID=396597 RepID=B1SZI9_9BURK|nr:hypothetical protein BamMEX5DRAFT_0955 [Burkholderia ambifaria MEX-5]